MPRSATWVPLILNVPPSPVNADLAVVAVLVKHDPLGMLAARSFFAQVHCPLQGQLGCQSHTAARQQEGAGGRQTLYTHIDTIIERFQNK